MHLDYHPDESVICHLCLFYCVVLCVCVYALFLIFPCVLGACVLQTLSLSFLPIYSLWIHFLYISIFTSWLLILCFNVPSCLFLSSFHIHLCVLSCSCTCACALAHNASFHTYCTFLLLRVLQWELWVEKGRQKEDFPLRNRTAGNVPVRVWKRSVVLEIHWFHGCMMPDKRWSINTAVRFTGLLHIWYSRGVHWTSLSWPAPLLVTYLALTSLQAPRKSWTNHHGHLTAKTHRHWQQPCWWWCASSTWTCSSIRRALWN